MRIVHLINEGKEKALTFLKVIWQFLWTVKPREVFHNENHYKNDANFFLPILQETLIKLPQIAGNVDNLLQNRNIARIIKKSVELLTVFT